MIAYRENGRLFTLQTKHSTYQMQVGQFGYLLHLYYGARIEEEDLSYLVCSLGRGFCGNPYETGEDRSFSLDTLPQEYSCFGLGDYRESCLHVVFPDGSQAVDLRYLSHEITDGKPGLPGLPAVYAREEQAQTLKITLVDEPTGLQVVLSYSVLAELNVITRSVEVVNATDGMVKVHKALSCCLDFLDRGDFDFLTFYGKHAGERMLERTPTRHGKIRVDSLRGTSSHNENPFVILCDHSAGEEQGECYGASLIYSGNFLAQAEVDQINQTRLVMGIHPDGFCWTLLPGERFTAPETALSYSAEGLGALSRNYHKLIRNHICRGVYQHKRRPILINNWEATYFGFDDDKLVHIAEDASQLGIEMLVMDDGWFDNREGDMSGLGDWIVNEKKLKGGLPSLVERVNALGMKFGIWFEPEMVSEDSNLYRTHPDWCLHIPGRKGIRSRYQLVLDLSRADVGEYLYHAVADILHSANIEYVKWDMNRSLTDVWSASLPADRQGELYHRYVLGLYALLERLTAEFPQVLFEGCSGGGGRFDAGMLYYSPQFWCSDNTDAVERIDIQYGTSFGYPVSAMGAHVSAVPNHQTGRMTPLNTRGIVAMSGTFGYELDINQMTAEEKQEVQKQTAFFRQYYDLISHGDYYRLTNPMENREYAAWEFVSEDQSEALLSFVQLRSRCNPSITYLRCPGLALEKCYRIRMEDDHENTDLGIHSGGALLRAGLPMPVCGSDYQAVRFYLSECGCDR